MGINWLEGSKRIWIFLIVVEALIIGIAVVYFWPHLVNPVVTKILGLRGGLIGSAVGAMLATVSLGEDSLMDENFGGLDAVNLLWQPFAFLFGFGIYAALMQSYMGGWVPPLPYIFSNLLFAGGATALAGWSVFAAPLLPFWFLNGFKRKK